MTHRLLRVRSKIKSLRPICTGRNEYDTNVVSASEAQRSLPSRTGIVTRKASYSEESFFATQFAQLETQETLTNWSTFRFACCILTDLQRTYQALVYYLNHQCIVSVLDTLFRYFVTSIGRQAGDSAEAFLIIGGVGKSSSSSTNNRISIHSFDKLTPSCPIPRFFKSFDTNVLG
jgi:hypothetical protein